MCKKTLQILLLCFVSIILFSCDESDFSSNPDTSSNGRPNILLIISDDMGKDATAGFSEGTTKPTTPHLNELKNNGLTFNNFWVNPTCSPTRSSIITGKYGYRTGVKNAGDVLSSSETILQKYISEQTNNAYATAIVGKWHLSGSNSTFNPETFGVDYYKGLIMGAATSYYSWEMTEDGSTQTETEYMTTKFTDLAIDWVNDQSKPWFLWMAYTAPHTPFHVPPTGTHSQGSLPTYINGLNEEPYFMAAIESMDFEIGRLLDNIPQDELDNTIIIYLGDNGTPRQVSQAPYTKNNVKGTLYQGGINTPLIISGKGVSRLGIDQNLVNGTDLFATISSLAGISTSEIHDSKSIVPLFTANTTHRDFQYSEISETSSDIWTIRNDGYKLIIRPNGTDEMYDMTTDPYETINLLSSTLSAEATAAKQALEAELVIIRN